MLCGSHTVLCVASFNSPLNVLRVIIMWEISHIIFYLFILSLLDVKYNLWIMFSRSHSIALLSIPHISLFSFTCIEDRLHLPSIRNTTDHYDDVIMGAIASQITSLTIVCSTVYSDADQRKTSKLRVTGICVGNSPGTGEFPAKMASNAENVSICWRHHDVNALNSVIVCIFLYLKWTCVVDQLAAEPQFLRHTFAFFKIVLNPGRYGCNFKCVYLSIYLFIYLKFIVCTTMFCRLYNPPR